MTAEIAVMNTKAVALAADSAVTINYGEKVYHSVDKLFQLSCVHPVGVMFYGRDNFLNIPWETIIKSYRQRLKDAHFPTVSAYARDFFQFLQQAEFDAASKNGREALFVLEAIQMELKAMEKKLTDLKNRLFKKLGEFVPHDEKMKIYNEQAEQYLLRCIRYLKKDYIHPFGDEDFATLMDTYSDFIEKKARKLLTEKLMKEDWLELVKAIVLSFLLKDFSNYKSGIVFAGFGEQEYLPSVVAFEVDGKINGKLKFRLVPEKTKKIDEQINTSIIPFAQVDMVDAFITGIDYQLENYYLSEIEKMLETIPKQMKQLVKTKWDAADLDALEAEMYVKLIQLYRDFNEKIQRFKEKRFIDPIIYNVQVLPKKELAEMAEALVQLTSFKRKVTAAVESVGGPIDVAVISKSDGFVWFKKKQTL